ncbi:calpain-B-like isoform X4, partial [Biomphalaria glabrata]
FPFPGFGVDTCRSMVAMHDGDLSGKLGYDEFKNLWEDLRRWKGVFKEFDKDKSGNLSSYELRNALNHVGFHISNRTFKSLVMRYSNKNGQVDFGDFIMCAIRLKTMLTSFRGHDPQNRGFAPYDIDSFIQITMYS